MTTRVNASASVQQRMFDAALILMDCAREATKEHPQHSTQDETAREIAAIDIALQAVFMADLQGGARDGVESILASRIVPRYRAFGSAAGACILSIKTASALGHAMQEVVDGLVDHVPLPVFLAAFGDDGGSNAR